MGARQIVFKKLAGNVLDQGLTVAHQSVEMGWFWEQNNVMTKTLRQEMVVTRVKLSLDGTAQDYLTQLVHLYVEMDL